MRNGDSKQGTESSLHPLSLRARFFLEVWMASSMRSIRSRERNNGGSKRARESDHPRPYKKRPFTSAVMTDNSMRRTLRPDNTNLELKQSHRSSPRRRLLLGLRISLALTVIFTQSI